MMKSTSNYARIPTPPSQPGVEARYDYEYERQGVANLFMFFALLLSQRHAKVTEHRTTQEWADALRELADDLFPHTGVIGNKPTCFIKCHSCTVQ